MRRSSYFSLFAIAILLASMMALAVGSFSAGVNAQEDAASGLARLPATPDPELCQIEPRTVEEMEAFVDTPRVEVFEPVVITVGTPANEEVVNAVIDTILESQACINAGKFFHLEGLYTEAGFVAASTGVVDQELIDFYLSITEPFLEEEHRSSVHSVWAVQVLADGRVAAFVQFQTDGAGGIDLMIFAEENGRYLIDDWVDEPYDVQPDWEAIEGGDEATPEA